MHDVIAEKLEAKGLWRRAAYCWLDVMKPRCATDAQRDWLSRRRRYCLSMASSPRPDNKLNISAIHRAAMKTQKKMGVDASKSIRVASEALIKDLPRG